jgi:hypothetical protein
VKWSDRKLRWLSVMIAGLAILCFFLQEKMQKKMQDRNDQSSIWKLVIYMSNTKCLFFGMEIAFISSKNISRNREETR